MKLLNLFTAKSQENPLISGGRSERPQNRPNTPACLSDVYNSGTRAKKRLVDGRVSGRSMVEMLGVLAIIGVLSVGAISGYQKAMTKYRWNIFVHDTNTLIMNTKKIIGSTYFEKENLSLQLEKTRELPGGYYRGDHSSGILKYKPELGFGYAGITAYNGSNIQLCFFGASIDFCRKVLQTNWEDLAWNSQLGGIYVMYTEFSAKRIKQAPTISEIESICQTSDESTVVKRVVLFY